MLAALVQAVLHLEEGDADLIAVASAEQRGAAVILAAEAPRPLARVGAVALGSIAASRIVVAGPGVDGDAIALVDACRSIAVEGTTVIEADGLIHSAVRLERP